jgi:predicted RNA binding protein YcfA (HicA-like mRNA interferase family)
MRLPRDISGLDLAKKLEVYGYRITRQTGSHMRLSTQERGNTILLFLNIRIYG